MVNYKFLATSLFIFITLFTGFSQSTNDWHLKLGTNYSHGFITENTQTMQLHGNLGFEKNNFELRLDGFYFMGQQGDRTRFSINHQLFLGGFHYFFKENFRPYIGAQFGLSYTQSTEYGIINAEDVLTFEPAFNPLVSAGLGFDYKLNNRLDLNLECRQIMGKHISNSYPTYLDEFRVSIGVGFYLINKSTN
ncbi:MAG: hypothetical protein R3279_00085 [Putridiphycobacter sp.]|nr:hypothetical protein [Putridiphycobacter sp.]